MVKHAQRLPAAFSDLQKFVDAGWALETISERFDKRRNSTMPELQEYYDSLMARFDEAVTYLNGFSLDAMPEDARTLLRLYQSLTHVEPSLTLWKSPDQADAFPADRIEILVESVV